MLELRFYVDGEEKSLPLGDREIRFGRSGENEVVLPDYSVSRRHASIQLQGHVHVISDLNSTNGVQVNGQNVSQAQLRGGDLLKVGVFEIRVHDTAAAQPPAAAGPPPIPGAMAAQEAAFDPPAAGPPPAPPRPLGSLPRDPGPEPPLSDSAISNATIVRSIKDLSADLGLLEPGGALGRDSSAVRQSKREALDEAYASKIFGFLSRLARMLITTESDDEILAHVMDIAFDVFPVDRGFILLRDDEAELVCELMRVNERAEKRPSGEVPISRTMLEAVMRERVALFTYDALSDQRLAGTESVRIHQIRAAMCTPLWSGEKIIGVMQLDTPHHTGTFTKPDVDLLATLANYCAVAIERNRNAREAEFQREVRNRLQRYHSPSVIEEVMQEGASPEGSIQRLKKAEVTVMFADIVGFTAFSENSQPEEVAELMERYFTYAVEAIFSYGGTLDKFIGDCVMAFFGAPFAHRDHAFRAVSAAVKIREDLERWNAERRSEGLETVKTRVAINTGPVVVGDIGSNRRVDYTVLGNTVNVAARLEEKVATPGDIVLGESTFRDLEGRIPTESLGGFQLKGLSRQIQAHRVR
ncbi:MAG: adenylate/guanylate cyclase domain-containing protein [Acidobacteriota bacterium]